MSRFGRSLLIIGMIDAFAAAQMTVERSIGNPAGINA